MTDQPFGDPTNLLGRFAFRKDDLGHSVPQGSVVIQLGETKIFEGHVPHSLESRIYVSGAAAHFFQ